MVKNPRGGSGKFCRMFGGRLSGFIGVVKIVGGGFIFLELFKNLD